MKSPPEASPRQTQTWTSGTSHRPPRRRLRRAGSGLTRRFVLAQQRAELGGDLRNGLGRQYETTVPLSRDDVLGPPLRIGLRKILASVAAAALFADQRAARDRFGDADEVLEIEREVPARVVDARAGHTRAGRASAKPLESGERFLQLITPADDPDEHLHRVLQLRVDRVRALVAALFALRLHPLRAGVHLRFVDLRCARAFAVFGRGLAGAASEDEQVGQRVAAETVRAVHACRDLASRIEP